jgi:hypothetical protein
LIAVELRRQRRPAKGLGRVQHAVHEAVAAIVASVEDLAGDDRWATTRCRPSPKGVGAENHVAAFDQHLPSQPDLAVMVYNPLSMIVRCGLLARLTDGHPGVELAGASRPIRRSQGRQNPRAPVTPAPTSAGVAGRGRLGSVCRLGAWAPRGDGSGELGLHRLVVVPDVVVREAEESVYAVELALEVGLDLLGFSDLLREGIVAQLSRETPRRILRAGACRGRPRPPGRPRPIRTPSQRCALASSPGHGCRHW